MDYTLACQMMLRKLRLDDPRRSSRPTVHGTTTYHAHWMLLQIIEHEQDWSQSKRGRWLGWAQCVLAMNGRLRLPDCKDINRQCMCEQDHCPQRGTPHVHNKWDVVQVPSELGTCLVYRIFLPNGKWSERVIAVSEEDAQVYIKAKYGPNMENPRDYPSRRE